MSDILHLHFDVPGDDYSRAGEASSAVKHTLKQLAVDAQTIRRVAVAIYEGEINLVIHGGGGKVSVDIHPDRIEMLLTDHGPGIPDVALAMTEGYSTADNEARNLGFGAGMGLPNMKKYTDEMEVTSEVGAGTTVQMTVRLP